MICPPFCTAHPQWRLRLVGMGSADRASAGALVERLGVTEQVELMPWLDDDEFLIRGRVHRDLAAVLREQDLA